MAKNCFTAKEEKDLGLEGKSREEQVAILNEKFAQVENKIRQNKHQALAVLNMRAANNRYKERYKERFKEDYDKIADKDVDSPEVLANKKSKRLALDRKVADRAMNARLNKDRFDVSNELSIRGEIDGIEAGYMRMLQDVYVKMRPKKFDYDRKIKENLLFAKIAYGEKVDPVYKSAVEGWQKMNKAYFDEFNVLGGNIKNLQDWILPTYNNARMIKDMGSEAWIKLALENVDLKKMGIKAGDFSTILRKSFDEMNAKGDIEFDLGAIYAKSKLANKHQQRRFLKFKDAEAYTRYNEKASGMTPFDTMTVYAREAALDIGLMRNMGPNPDTTLRTFADERTTPWRTYQNLAGKTSSINMKVSEITDSLRNAATGFKLTGAALTAIADISNDLITRSWNGMPMARLFKHSFDELMQTDAGVALAAKMGAPIDHLLNSIHQDFSGSAGRFTEMGGGAKLSKRFSDMIMKTSGLEKWTYIRKQRFFFDFLFTLKNNLDNPNLRKTLDTYGFREKDIEVLRNAKSIDLDGTLHLDTSKLSPKMSERVIGMIREEMRFAIIEGDDYIKGVLNRGFRKGTLEGEAARFASQFKMFPTAQILNQYSRAIYGRNSGLSGRLAYFGASSVMLTITGGIALQLSEISKGRTPADMDKPEFWMNAAIKGGLAPFFIDFFYGEQRKYGQTWVDFVAGPVAAMAEDLINKALFGTLSDAIFADKELTVLLKKNLSDKAMDYVPGQLWYTKLIMEQAFMNEIRRWGDPDFDKKQRIRDKQRYKDFGNERWVE